MKNPFSLLLVLSSLIGWQCSTPKVTETDNQEKETTESLVWIDEFNSDQLDTTKWNIIVSNGCPSNCGFGNNELQYYTDQSQNLEVSNGSLKITALKETFKDRDYTSAKLITKNKGDWQYGRIEVSAKLPEGKGTWPAIWMLPTLDRSMDWPLDGEIDIMEHVGYNQGMVYGTIHTKKFNHIIGTQKSDSLFLGDISSAFHVYGFEWGQDKMIWTIDNKEYLTLVKGEEDYEGWPFDQKFHLILNLAVGGNWGGKYGVDDSIWPQTFEVDYVKVYQRK